MEVSFIQNFYTKTPSLNTKHSTFNIITMVGIGGLEPPTSSLSEMRSNQLSYTPVTEFS